MDKVTVPEGKSGNWSVEQFEISEKASEDASIDYRYRAPRPGKYSRLIV